MHIKKANKKLNGSKIAFQPMHSTVHTHCCKQRQVNHAKQIYIYRDNAVNYLNLDSPGRIAWLYSGSFSAAAWPLDEVADHLLHLVLKSSY